MTLVLIILALSFLIIIHELGHFFAARMRGIKVEEFGLGYPPLALKLFVWKGTIFSLNWIPFGGFVRMAGESDLQTTKDAPKSDSYYGASIVSRLIVLLAGVTCNFVFGALAFALIFTRYGIPQPINDARIGYVMPNSPAAAVHLPEKSSIVAVGSGETRVETPDSAAVIAYIQEHKGEEMSLFVRDNCTTTCTGDEVTYRLRARTAEETPEGEGSLGVVFQTSEPVFFPAWQMPVRGIVYGTSQAIEMGKMILSSLGQLVTTLAKTGKLEQDLSGPVGIVSQAQTAGVFSEGFFVALSFVGMLSINLAIMNLLPVPPLDGGKAVLTALESIINRHAVQRVDFYLSYGGYVLLLGLIVVITIRDIFRLF